MSQYVARAVAALEALSAEVEIQDIAVERGDFGGSVEWAACGIVYSLAGETRTFIGGPMEGDSFYVDAPGAHLPGVDPRLGRQREEQCAVITGSSLLNIDGALSSELNNDSAVYDEASGDWKAPHIAALDRVVYILPELSDEPQLWRASDRAVALPAEQQLPAAVTEALARAGL